MVTGGTGSFGVLGRGADVRIPDLSIEPRPTAPHDMVRMRSARVARVTGRFGAHVGAAGFFVDPLRYLLRDSRVIAMPLILST